MYDKRFRYKKVYRTLLLRYEDFVDEWFYDEYYFQQNHRPCIEFKLGPPVIGGTRVEKISIVYGQEDIDTEDNDTIIGIDPIKLVQAGFDAGHDEDNSKAEPISLNIESMLREAQDRATWSRQDYIPRLYGSRSFVAFAENVWDEYCLFEGTSTMWRTEFQAWIYRFTALTTDLLDFPFEGDSDWSRREEFIRKVATTRLGEEYECFFEKHWKSLVAMDNTFQQQARKARLKDACVTIEQFRSRVAPNHPLEAFLHSIVDAFVRELTVQQLIKQCAFCAGFFPAERKKQYCSLLSEDRDCGKAARNRRNYLNRSEEQRERVRQGNRELRLFYREKGIGKRRTY